MATKQSYRMVNLMVVIVCGCQALAGAAVGLPMALLEEGQWAPGVEYGHEVRTLEAYGLCTLDLDGEPANRFAQLFKIDDLKTNLIFTTLGYGLSDNWDIFLRLGAADARDDIRADAGGDDALAGQRFALDGRYGWAWGAGTRVTLAHWGPWSFAGSMQVTWQRPGSSTFTLSDPNSPGRVLAGDARLDLWQTEVALAAVYQIDTLHFWAGPFLQFVEGDFGLDGQLRVDGVPQGTLHAASRIEEASQLGLHVGGKWEVTRRLNCWAGAQFTGDSWSIALGGLFIPEKLFAGM